MEFLKTLFEKGALTWERFQQAAKDAKFEVVNAAGGAYVPKADLQHTMDARRLRTACQKLVMVGQFFVSPAAFLGWQPLEVLKG